MKILIAIESSERAKDIFKNTLRWVVRTGFDVRVFVDPSELEAYREGARDANYQYYLDLTDNHFVANTKGQAGILELAKKSGFDLIAILPDDLTRFDRKGTSHREELMIIDFAKYMGIARVEFGKKPDLQEYKISNRVKVQRVL